MLRWEVLGQPEPCRPAGAPGTAEKGGPWMLSLTAWVLELVAPKAPGTLSRGERGPTTPGPGSARPNALPSLHAPPGGQGPRSRNARGSWRWGQVQAA